MKFRERKSALQKKAHTKNNCHIMSRSIRTPKANNSHLRTVGVVQASHNFLILVI